MVKTTLKSKFSPPFAASFSKKKNRRKKKVTPKSLKRTPVRSVDTNLKRV